MTVERDEFRELSKKVSDQGPALARLEEQVKTLFNAQETFVTKAEFGPVKLIAFGLASLAMSSVLLAVLAKVVVR
jgi:hypothetical protein